MPFDVLADRPYTMADCLQKLGIRPIPMEQLAAYKAEQIRLHPPHLLATKTPYMVAFAGWFTVINIWLGSSVGFSGGWLPFAVAISLCASAISTALSAVLTVAFCRILDIPIKGRAYWRTTYSANASRAPQPIESIARQIKKVWPVTFVTGTLIQNDIDLDPYLLAQSKTGEVVCLGIWDYYKNGTPKIIAVAEMD